MGDIARGAKADALTTIACYNHVQYCAANSYDYIVRFARYPEDHVVHPWWFKARFMRDVLARGYDWVFWTDRDALFTNCGIRVEALIDLARSTGRSLRVVDLVF